jgi:hypothetical protein
MNGGVPPHQGGPGQPMSGNQMMSMVGMGAQMGGNPMQMVGQGMMNQQQMHHQVRVFVLLFGSMLSMFLSLLPFHLMLIDADAFFSFVVYSNESNKPGKEPIPTITA